jgi:hypothetical protein
MHVATDNESREWIIQRCVNIEKNEYEDWPPFDVKLMTRSEMLEALKCCEESWPAYEFRGHNVTNQQPGADILRTVR